MKTIRFYSATIKRGILLTGDFLWDLILIPNPFLPVMFFYNVMPVLVVYLHENDESGRRGLDGLAASVNIAWWLFPVIFICCSIIGYANKNPKINAALSLPMMFYAFNILALSVSGFLTVGGLIIAIYMLVAGWLALSLTRYYYELANVKIVIKELTERQNKKGKLTSDD